MYRFSVQIEFDWDSDEANKLANNVAKVPSS